MTETVHKWAQWCRGHGPEPGRRALECMFATMQARMRSPAGDDLVPVYVNEARAFRVGGGASAQFLCVVSVVFASGNPRGDRQSFACWWAWRHVRFAWSRQELPAPIPVACEPEPA